MPGLKDDPNKFSGEIGHASSGVESLASASSCLGVGCVPYWELLNQITTLEPCFPRGVEDPAGTPGARTCVKSHSTDCNLKFCSQRVLSGLVLHLTALSSLTQAVPFPSAAHERVGMCHTR